MSFLFENLLVYQKSLCFIEISEKICQSIKGKVTYPIIDQLSRAAIPIPLNIAEGNGRWHKKEKIQFFRISRGSVFEIVPIVQVLYKKSLLSESEYKALYQQLDELAKMLTALIRSIDSPN